MAEDPAPNNNGAQAPHPRQDVDVLLDVSELEVDLIDLEVEGLKAHVSVLASTPTCKPRQPADRRRRQAGPGQARDRGRAGQAALEGPARQRARHPHPRPEHRGRHSEILRSLARALDELLTGRLGDALGTLESVLGGLEGAARSTIAEGQAGGCSRHPPRGLEPIGEPSGRRGHEPSLAREARRRRAVRRTTGGEK